MGGFADRDQNDHCSPSMQENKSASPVEAVEGGHSSALELAARGQAPVKAEFLSPKVQRIPASSIADADDAREEERVPTKISSEKKSKRQQKRERSMAKNLAEGLCGAVARTGDVNACVYGASCRFNHDISCFLAQKPSDLPGDCPFVYYKKPCPFGLSCRYAGTHDRVCKGDNQKEEVDMDPHELNVLSKEKQRLLWKNNALFPKSDIQLRLLGLMNKGKYKSPTSIPLKENFEEVASEDAEIPDNISDAGKEKKLVRKASDDNSSPDSKKAKNNDDQWTVIVDSNAQAENVAGMQENGIDGIEVEASLLGLIDDEKLNKREKKLIDFRKKLYLAPLTTVGNLPFRRICRVLGADITCGEMAMCTNLLQGQASEWALLRRHSSEDMFGVQICGPYADTLARTVELIEQECTVDFIDINVGCPIDIVVKKGAGSFLLTKPAKLGQIVKACSAVMNNPLTLKVRTGYFEGRNCIHSLIPQIREWGATAVTVHGRTRQQRYSKVADWDYIYKCAEQAGDLQVIGNGDVFSFTDWNEHLASGCLSTCLIARGALIKPWLFTEIKEQRHWDISANERLDILRDYVRYGLEHWGSDSKGVETTRHFLLEWLSYSHKYIPVGLLEIVPQKLNWRPPNYFGRNDLETLMASDSAADWVRLSEILLGPAPPGFIFTPKHKSNAYDKAENG